MASISRNISLRALRAFCVAAERESFREAADLLFLTSSAVSHQIKALESELGLKLFERTPRSLELTASGQSLYDDVRPLLQDLDAVIGEHARAKENRSLRISVQPFFASELFVPRLPEFVAEHSDLDISVDTSDESPEKHPGAADVSIRVFGTVPPTLASDRLFQLCLTPAGSAEFCDRVKIKSGKIVGDFPLVVHESRPKAWQEWEQTSRIKVPDHSNSIRLDSMIAVARAAERGMGAALVPKYLSDSWFESSSLVQLFDHDLRTQDTFYFVSSKKDRDNEDIKVFREWVLQNFADRS